jgi:haloalkane dehalogenase
LWLPGEALKSPGMMVGRSRRCRASRSVIAIACCSRTASAAGLHAAVALMNSVSPTSGSPTTHGERRPRHVVGAGNAQIERFDNMVRPPRSNRVNSVDNHRRRRIRVLDTEMSYVDTGRGDPVVFLHGNPTSSYLWRNIIPYLSGHRRCLAPDLVGMGQSGKSSTKAYRFVDHARYLDAWFEALDLTNNIALVLHDWGSALGFYRSFRYPEQIKAIAYMEAILQPRLWVDFPNGRDGMFRAMRSPEGERLVLDENFFIETVLPKSIIRRLSEQEMDAYRAPFRERDARLPMLIWPRELPIEGEPTDVVALVTQYGEWLAKSNLPKLFIVAEPGSILVGRAAEFCRRWPNQREVKVPGIHFIQEDAPVQIGEALETFIRDL